MRRDGTRVESASACIATPLPPMQTLKWIVAALALIQGAWLTFDGTRAFITGDYVTPRSGPSAGQLGPWSKMVSAAGLEPRGSAMKSIHVVLGLSWLAALALWHFRPDIGWPSVLICSIATLWYLPVGTVLSLIQIGLLIALRTKVQGSM